MRETTTKTRTVSINNSGWNRRRHLDAMLEDTVQPDDVVALTITSTESETDLAYMLRLRSLIAECPCLSTKYDLLHELYELDYRGEK